MFIETIHQQNLLSTNSEIHENMNDDYRSGKLII